MLTIYNNSINVSDKLSNYLTDSVQMSFDNDDHIYIGYYKPINAIYLELETTQLDTTAIELKYFNGAFVDLSFNDETNALKRSGFIKWTRNQAGQVKNTISGSELYWYKLVVKTPSNVVIDFNGINLVFSKDSDLKEEYPSILDSIPDGQVSFIGFHQSAREDIISNLGNREEVLKDDGLLKQLDQFDLLDSSEVKNASKYLVLSKIFAWLSDNTDDKWKQKSDGFYNQYSNMINRFRFSIDKNDNGTIESDEQQAISVLRVVRE